MSVTDGGWLDTEAPVVLTRANADRTRKAMYRLFGLQRDDLRWPKHCPPGSFVMRKRTNLQAGDVAPEYNDPASDYCADPALYASGAAGAELVRAAQATVQAGEARMQAYQADREAYLRACDAQFPPLTQEEAWARLGSCRMTTGPGGMFDMRWECPPDPRVDASTRCRDAAPPLFPPWAGFSLEQGFTYDGAQVPPELPSVHNAGSGDVSVRAMVAATQGWVASVAGAYPRAWTWVPQYSNFGGVSVSLLHVNDPRSDEWWYDTDFGRQEVVFEPPDIAQHGYGGWSPAERVAVPPGAGVLVRVAHPYIVGLGPAAFNGTTRQGTGNFALVRGPAYALIPQRMSGSDSFMLGQLAPNVFMARFVHRESDSRWDNIVDAIEEVGQDIAAEVNRVDDNLDRIGREIGRLDDNLKRIVRHPGDAIKVVGRILLKAVVVYIVVVGAPVVLSLLSTGLLAPLAAAAGAVVNVAAGPLISALGTVSATAGPAMTASLLQAGALSVSLAMPPQILEEIAKAAVYCEGFIPLLPFAIQELSIQAQTSSRRRDELRIELAQLRADVVKRGGAWLIVAQRAVDAITAVILILNPIAEIAYIALKTITDLAVSAAELALQLLNGLELAGIAKDRAREQNEARLRAAEERRVREQAELDVLLAELADLERLEAELAAVQAGGGGASSSGAPASGFAKPRLPAAGMSTGTKLALGAAAGVALLAVASSQDR